MTPDQYLRGVLARYRPTGQLVVIAAINRANLMQTLRGWAGAQLNGIFISGSVAKGTAISGGTDLDYLVSLKPSTEESLKEIYNKLFTYLKNRGSQPQRQNVSVGLTIGGFKVDLIPAKKRPGNTLFHSIYHRKSDSWRQTNIHRHILVVKNSGSQHIVRLMKIWRDLHHLNFPSFCLEMISIRALKPKRLLTISQQFERTLEHIASRLPYSKIEDPANTSNNLADDMTSLEKQSISNQARESLDKAYWEDIVW